MPLKNTPDHRTGSRVASSRTGWSNVSSTAHERSSRSDTPLPCGSAVPESRPRRPGSDGDSGDCGGASG
jgi:hypothetical protein